MLDEIRKMSARYKSGLLATSNSCLKTVTSLIAGIAGRFLRNKYLDEYTELNLVGTFSNGALKQSLQIVSWLKYCVNRFIR